MVKDKQKNTTKAKANGRVEVLLEKPTLDAFRRKCSAAGVSMNAALNACVVAVLDGVCTLENARRPRAVILQGLAGSHQERIGEKAG